VWKYGRITGFLLLCCGIGIMAAEVEPPAGTEISFDSGSPTSGKAHISGSGEYKIPANWNNGGIKFTIYKVKGDGTKSDLVDDKDADYESGTWFSTILNLTSNTEYYVEARLKVTKMNPDFTTDYAYKRVEVKKKTTN
jgi:hypothetical protein